MNQLTSSSPPAKAAKTVPARVAPGLDGVPETMLWALHNRAVEARRPDAVLVDPACLHIHGRIDYDFAAHFGDPSGSLAVRAAAIDTALRHWLRRHPAGVVVSLGEGLETQRHRVDNGRMRWLSVDLPEAIRLRERFLPPGPRFRHLATSALDPAWMDAVDPADGVFVVAQGLLMYLDPDRVRDLLSRIADRFAGAEIVFDVIPRWFSDLTLRGVQQTPQYRLPPMPWGVDGDEIAEVLRRWHPGLATVTFLDYGAPRGWWRLAGQAIDRHPLLRHQLPRLVHVTIAGRESTSARTVPMSSSGHPSSGQIPGPVADILAAASRNAGDSRAIALAAGQVIASRTALGVDAALNPLAADHAEFRRMVPEKVEAFAAAGMIVWQQSVEAQRQIAAFASDEMLAASRATLALAGCRTPACLAKMQTSYARAWFERTAANVFALGMFALTAQAAAMTPIHTTVTANVARLSPP